uniref:hypothetical protein n=2 Tax=Heyndrickxia coagulans TaxID=1398 RepID=UPI00036672D8
SSHFFPLICPSSKILHILFFMRKIYEFMSRDEKKKAISLLTKDIDELKKEQKLEDEKGYPRVIKDAIEETIQRYIKDMEYLKDDLKKEEKKS